MNKIVNTFINLYYYIVLKKTNKEIREVGNKMTIDKMKLSKYQQAILSFVDKGAGNAVVHAVAGSGKTTTAVMICSLIPKGKNAVFVAFNKAIQMELSRRLPSTVEAKTLHGLGYSFFGKNGSRPQLDTNKVFNLIVNEIEDIPEEPIDGPCKKDYLMFLKRIIPLIKNTMTDYTRLEALEDLKAAFNIDDFDIDPRTMLALKKIMEKNNAMTSIIDYDDMVYLPVVNRFTNGTYDWVIVDELQDLNKTQFELIKKICNSKTRIIGVGDKCQSIYAFRGADTRSMEKFTEEFKAIQLPLSICYRCPASHIKLAQEIVPEIEASPTAKEGIVENVEFQAMIEKADDRRDDLVLSRTNAPLVEVAFSLIRAGKKATIRGKDIGANLIKMIDKYKPKSLEDLYLKLDKFKGLQMEKLALIEKGKYDAKKKTSLLTVVDSIETIYAIMQDCETVDQVKKKIEAIFSDDRNGVVCSSVHKAKGLEANVVFIIGADKMPHPMAKTPEEKEQEMNIKYVALTRSKSELYFVEKKKEM